MAISLSEIKSYRALAAKYAVTRGAKVINHLLDELQVMRNEITELRLKTADMYGEYDDWTPCPFGKEHKGTILKDVPWDFLMWWLKENSDRELIIFEMDYGPWPKRKAAVKKLRLHDYLKQKIATNGTSLQQT